ncbi:MAG: aldehyde dehydrogenase (NADP(+)) [Candidatus Aminicenantes bacterium]
MTQPVLIDGHWRQPKDPAGSFQPESPVVATKLPEVYPVSGFKDLEHAVQASMKAVQECHQSDPQERAEFLDRFAENIEQTADTLVKTASMETGLPIEPRLKSVELPRTTGQLRQAAAAVRDRSWCRCIIDTKLNIRSMYASLGGPVVVIGPNNFPLAFNAVSGGDFAAAIAAGNPVIAKAHPSHPGTTKALAETAFQALQKTSLPRSMVQMVYHMHPASGLRLVSHPQVAATSFTGNKAAGLRLKESAEKAGNLIYLEMSSINPVIILPGAVRERGPEIAGELFASCTLGMGQFCTNPGVVIYVGGHAGKNFTVSVREKFCEEPKGVLLSKEVIRGLKISLRRLQDSGARLLEGGKPPRGEGYRFQNTLLKISGKEYLKSPDELQTEAFGPSTLLVEAEDVTQIMKIIETLEGNLTGTIYSHSGDRDNQDYQRIEPLLRRKVGRLLNNKMPTGVAVTPAMHHGGPFPASGHPGFTSVGIPPAIWRFAAVHAYDHVREDRLPHELRDKNPTGKMWRYIDGTWSQRDI